MSHLEQDVLDQISDDLQFKIDNFLMRMRNQTHKEIRKLHEDLRAVCVDYPHVPADAVKKLYVELVTSTFTENAITGLTPEALRF